jgi:hypothetical protein
MPAERLFIGSCGAEKRKGPKGGAAYLMFGNWKYDEFSCRNQLRNFGSFGRFYKRYRYLMRSMSKINNRRAGCSESFY